MPQDKDGGEIVPEGETVGSWGAHQGYPEAESLQDMNGENEGVESGFEKIVYESLEKMVEARNAMEKELDELDDEDQRKGQLLAVLSHLGLSIIEAKTLLDTNGHGDEGSQSVVRDSDKLSDIPRPGETLSPRQIYQNQEDKWLGRS